MSYTIRIQFNKSRNYFCLTELFKILILLMQYLANLPNLMQRQKYQLANRHDSIRNPELTPKIPAKKPINIRKKIIAGQQSAHQNNRNPHRLLVPRESDLSSLSDQQIKTSAIFRLLEEEVRTMSNRHQVELMKLRQIKNQKEKQLNSIQKQQYNTKMQIWQLKNEVLELKQSIKQENEETVRLIGELGIQEIRSEDDPGLD